jgi:hypothetical protein
VIFQCFALVSIIAIVALQFVDPTGQTVPEGAERLMQWLHEHRFAIVCSLLGIQVASGVLASLFDWWSEKSAIEAHKIKQTLDRLVARHFPKRGSDFVYRATLFRERSCWFFGRWLGVVQRSGEVYRKWGTIFSVDPDSRKYNTGFAGQCWFLANSGQAGVFHHLVPDVREDDSRKDEYMAQGFIDEREFKGLSVPSCFFHVSEIRRRGKIWGVLVIDSTDPSVAPKTKPETSRQRSVLEDAVHTISLLIE